MDLCRSCLATKDLQEIDDTFVTNYNLLTNLNIMLHDGLPQLVCKICLDIVASYISFRENCATSEARIKLMIEDHIKSEDSIGRSFNSNTDDIKEEIKNESDFDYDNKFEIDIDLDYCKNEELTEDSRKRSKSIKKKKKSKQNKLKSISLKVQKDTGKLLCGICSESFDEKLSLSVHIETHKNDTNCTLCREKFQSWQKLFAHRYDHLPTTQRMCHICFKKYKVIEILVFHYFKNHSEENNTPVHCKNCSRTFNKLKTLQNHVSYCQARHVFVCDHCSKSFNQKYLLISHMSRHMDQRPHTCNICGNTFKRKATLQYHILTRHCKTRVDCLECKRVFPNQESLDQHNCKKRQYKMCPDCGKQFLNTVYYSHIQSHDKVGRYKCTMCTAVYKYKQNLQVHLNRHLDDRKYHCAHCEARFFSNTQLKKHTRTHTGERPYVCEICQRAFIARYNLKKHMQTHGIYLINAKTDKDT